MKDSRYSYSPSASTQREDDAIIERFIGQRIQITEEQSWDMRTMQEISHVRENMYNPDPQVRNVAYESLTQMCERITGRKDVIDITLKQISECKKITDPVELTNIKKKHEEEIFLNDEKIYIENLLQDSINLQKSFFRDCVTDIDYITKLNILADKKEQNPELVTKTLQNVIRTFQHWDEKGEGLGNISKDNIAIIKGAGGYAELPKVVRDSWLKDIVAYKEARYTINSKEPYLNVSLRKDLIPTAAVPIKEEPVVKMHIAEPLETPKRNTDVKISSVNQASEASGDNSNKTNFRDKIGKISDKVKSVMNRENKKPDVRTPLLEAQRNKGLEGGRGAR